ncbi:MAG TPA: hypothetical protein VF956_11170 [Candidatus Dormibacteraeota bacterium]
MTDCTVLIQTAGFGLRASAVAASIKTARAPAAASASFLPVIGRYVDGDTLKRASEGSGVGGLARSSSAPRRSSKSGPS